MKGSKEPRINLLRYQQEESLEKQSNIRLILILGMAVFLLVGTMGGACWLQKQKLEAIKAENQKLQQQVDELSSSVVSIDKEKNNAEDNKRRTMINALKKQTKIKSKQFQEIYRLSIPGITIGKMDIKSDNSLTISAYCNNQAEFINFLEQLRELDYIKEVKNISSKSNVKTGEVSFNITLVWEEAE